MGRSAKPDGLLEVPSGGDAAYLAPLPLRELPMVGPRLAEALQAAGEQVTDESSAMESMGWQPRLVPSSARNFKVTYPEDFALAEALLLSDTQRKASS